MSACLLVQQGDQCDDTGGTELSAHSTLRGNSAQLLSQAAADDVQLSVPTGAVADDGEVDRASSDSEWESSTTDGTYASPQFWSCQLLLRWAAVVCIALIGLFSLLAVLGFSSPVGLVAAPPPPQADTCTVTRQVQSREHFPIPPPLERLLCEYRETPARNGVASLCSPYASRDDVTEADEIARMHRGQVLAEPTAPADDPGDQPKGAVFTITHEYQLTGGVVSIVHENCRPEDGLTAVSSDATTRASVQRLFGPSLFEARLVGAEFIFAEMVHQLDAAHPCTYVSVHTTMNTRCFHSHACVLPQHVSHAFLNIAFAFALLPL